VRIHAKKRSRFVHEECRWRIYFDMQEGFYTGEMAYWVNLGLLFYPPGRKAGAVLLRRQLGGGWVVGHIKYTTNHLGHNVPNEFTVVAGPFPSRRIAYAVWKLLTS
jgi:hypothetical protein